jgi:hypothetical protein
MHDRASRACCVPVTRRDYEMLAECFRRTLENKDLTPEMRIGVATAAREMSWELARLNSSFERWRFLNNAEVIKVPYATTPR